jgi:chemotaxis family two-component system sensor kinase Cph1
MGDEWAGLIAFDLSPVLVAADRAVNIGLILTELLINAKKYAYSGAPGLYRSAFTPSATALPRSFRTKGPGKVTTGEGFGTRMLNAMVKSLGGTIDESSANPGLRVTVNAPVQGRGEKMR